EKKRKRIEKIEERKLTRDKSREILLEHFRKVCQKDHYKPSKLQELSDEIANYMEEKVRRDNELKKVKIIEDNEEDLESIFLEHVNEEETGVESIASTIIEKEGQQI